MDKFVALGSQLVRAHPQLADNPRVGKALNLLRYGHVQMIDAHTFMVRSQSEADKAYLVDIAARSCPCPDCARGHVCKHRIASFLYLQTV